MLEYACKQWNSIFSVALAMNVTPTSPRTSCLHPLNNPTNIIVNYTTHVEYQKCDILSQCEPLSRCARTRAWFSLESKLCRL